MKKELLVCCMLVYILTGCVQDIPSSSQNEVVQDRIVKGTYLITPSTGSKIYKVFSQRQTTDAVVDNNEFVESKKVTVPINNQPINNAIAIVQKNTENNNIKPKKSSSLTFSRAQSPVKLEVQAQTAVSSEVITNKPITMDIFEASKAGSAAQPTAQSKPKLIVENNSPPEHEAIKPVVKVVPVIQKVPPSAEQAKNQVMVTTNAKPLSQDMLKKQVEISLPETLELTVRDGLEYVLLYVDYTLCNNSSLNSTLFNKPLPKSYHKLGPAPLGNILKTLTGPEWSGVLDGDKVVCFQRTK